MSHNHDLVEVVEVISQQLKDELPNRKSIHPEKIAKNTCSRA